MYYALDMNTTPQPVVVLAPGDESPAGSVVIRRESDDRYVIEESGVGITVTPQRKLMVDVPVGDSIGEIPMAQMETERFQYQTKAGQWVKIFLQDGQLAAE